MSPPPQQQQQQQQKAATPSQQQNLDGKPRWIHCTPLLGSDSKVGVWMVVMVESESITGHINVSQPPRSQNNNNPRPPPTSKPTPPNLGVVSPKYNSNSNSSPTATAATGPNRLYAEYLRREGRENGAPLREVHPAERQYPRGDDEQAQMQPQVQQGPWVPPRGVGGVSSQQQQQQQQSMRGRPQSRGGGEAFAGF